jgi:hypothetical protein
MNLGEFIRLKQGGDFVMQYLNKFNNLNPYAIDQVDTDLKNKNCFMRGLNDRLKRKMATCLDLTYSRAVNTALSVEANNAGQGKSKGYAGERSTQGPEKRTRLVIQPFNFKLFFSSSAYITLQTTCVHSSHSCPRLEQSVKCP